MKHKYIPNRNDILWLDLEPKKGKEIGKYRPCLCLSSNLYHKKTGLLICCPISTSIRGALTEVPISNLEKPSVVVSNIIHTLSWHKRKAKFITKAKKPVMEETLSRLLPLIGAQAFYE